MIERSGPTHCGVIDSSVPTFASYNVNATYIAQAFPHLAECQCRFDRSLASRRDGQRDCAVLDPLDGGWIHSRQLEVIDFLREENRILRCSSSTAWTSGECGVAVPRGPRCESRR
jgi:hypothetical protein